ncbi:cupredoxin domain-containing protein [Halorarum salinum]|uniref:Uncharacterized protein n=1 Tax=Halorarum salinum TaxID=2743089 RepID=A0A7D5QC10_9EURY|nr:hypothetical protein [Halobaculum salinum]QLG62280.1 hypothetical protein HUG12_11300 [Halobaculum salinum]
MVSTANETRRSFLASVGAASLAGLAGCTSVRFPGTPIGVQRTVYIGSFHWGFVLLREDGQEIEQLRLNRGTTVRLVAFNVNAAATERLPRSIRDALPEHEALEERNEGAIPEPSGGDLHELLEVANERNPHHGLAVMPATHGPGMMSGMMLHPVGLPADAGAPVEVTRSATVRGEFSLLCTVYCGYGHPYMNKPSAIVVS